MKIRIKYFSQEIEKLRYVDGKFRLDRPAGPPRKWS